MRYDTHEGKKKQKCSAEQLSDIMSSTSDRCALETCDSRGANAPSMKNCVIKITMTTFYIRK